MRISDWSSDVCSSDLPDAAREAIIRFLCRLSLPPVRRGGRRPLADRMTDETPPEPFDEAEYRRRQRSRANLKIGRASCRERVCQYVEISVVAVSLKKKKFYKEILHINQILNNL